MVDSELINSLGNDIKFDEMGNVTVGKNLEVGGNVFTLNGKQWGIMPVKSIDDNEKYSDMGFILSNILPHTSEDNRINVSGIWFNISNNYIKFCMSKSKYLTPGYTKTHIADGVLYISTHDIYKLEELFNTFLNGDYVSRMYQPKLYRHKLTINNLYILMYNSTSNIKVNSVTDLRTIMKISASKEEILPVCASDATAMVTLVVTDSLCQVDGTDVTTVSDVVSPL